MNPRLTLEWPFVSAAKGGGDGLRCLPARKALIPRPRQPGSAVVPAS
jgi:hypothetical protein